MKSYLKGLLSGVLITSLLLSGIGFTAVKTQKIDAIVNSIKLSVNGKYISSDNIIYKNTLYVPAQKISESLNKTFSWDKNKSVASISEPVVTSKYNMQNPAPLNTAQTVTVESFLGNHTAQITVTEIIKGDEAWKMILEANQFNSEPPTGKMYVLAKIKFSLINAADGKSISIHPANFDAFSSNNKKYDTPSTVTPEPTLVTDLYKGASHEGWAAFLVDSNDNAPKIAYGRSYDGSGGIWFSFK